jgi:prepilin-type N-terminal cleavage/methylation domain-containing protein
MKRYELIRINRISEIADPDVCYPAGHPGGRFSSVRRGFSAIELMVVVGVVSVLSAIAMPTMGRLLDRMRVRAAIIEIEALFSAARHAAIARASTVSVEIDTVAGAVSLTLNDDTLRRGELRREHGVYLSTNRSSMSYAATGIGYGAANLSVAVRKGSIADTIVVSRLGRVRH